MCPLSRGSYSECSFWRLYSSYTESVAHTHVGLCLVQVTEVASRRSPPSELYCGTVSTDNHSTIDEVEGTALYVVCDLETSLNKLLIRSTVGGHYSQSVECRTQAREHHMTTGACNAMVCPWKDSVHYWWVECRFNMDTIEMEESVLI